MCLFIPNCTGKIVWLLVNNIHAKISRWLSKSNARVLRNQGKFALWIAPSRACAWFENKRFDWPSVSYSFATFLSINLISTFCTQFQLSALFGINWHALSQSAWWNFCMYIITPSNRLYLACDIGFSREIWRWIPSSGSELSYIMNCSRGNDGLGLHKRNFAEV